jgi:Rrf2 family iron-sulfur cluster assembly transcriptional regulator
MPGQPLGCRGNQSRCQTHDLWEELGNQIYLYLSSVTVDDVISRRVLGTSGLAKPERAESEDENPCRVAG